MAKGEEAAGGAIHDFQDIVVFESFSHGRVMLLEARVKDPRLGFVTITDARVSGDLQHATVFYTVRGETLDDEQVVPRPARAAIGRHEPVHWRNALAVDAPDGELPTPEQQLKGIDDLSQLLHLFKIATQVSCLACFFMQC